MPPSPTLTARDARILAGHRAGRSLLDLALAENVDPAVVRRVLRAAGIDAGPLRPAPPLPACLHDPAWLRAEYATKSARQIAEELGCPRDAVYEALHAAGIPPRANGHGPKCEERITPELADRAVALYVQGWSLDLVADAVGLSRPQVSRLVEERGVKRGRSEAAQLAHPLSASPFGPEEWSQALQDEVLERYARGQSGELIAQLLELPASSVYRLLRERKASDGSPVVRSRGSRRVKPRPPADGTPRPRGAPHERELAELLPADQAAEALARYAAGEAPGAIAALLDVPKSRLYRFLERRGVLRSRSEAAKVRQAKRRELEQADED